MEIIISHNNKEISLIEYFLCDTFAGEMLVAQYADAVCFIAFVEQLGIDATLNELCSRFPKAKLRQISNSYNPTRLLPQKILLGGTKFQIEIWQTLLSVNYGETATYSEIASKAGYPKAIRATASAIGRNPISYIIPCHRIIPASKDAGNYHWGKNIKRCLLKNEGIILP